MIKKLQVECGHNAVNGMKTMYEDIQKSKQVITEYKQTQLNTTQDFEFSAEILTSGHWPYQDVPKCVLPNQLMSA